jgi:hypothetical protein
MRGAQPAPCLTVCESIFQATFEAGCRRSNACRARGLAYPAVAPLLACFLLDIAFFRARITSSVINAVANMVGSTVSVSPC